MTCKCVETINQALPAENVTVLDKPARVGSVVFQAGVSVQTVIDTAQRYHHQTVADQEIVDSHRLTKTLSLSAEELTELERLVFEALPTGVRSELTSLRDEVARFRSEQAYIIGHNDGWRDALRQEVFHGTVDADSPLQAAAREAGWALMEVVDEIDFRKREEVSDIASRLAAALLSTTTEPSDIPKGSGE